MHPRGTPNVLDRNFEYEQDVAAFIDMEPWLRENDQRLHARLFGAAVSINEQHLSALEDPGAIEDHLRRIQVSVVSDPGQAIGTAKELIESTTKLVLHTLGEPFDENDDMPTLIKAAQSALALHPSAVAPTSKGVDSTKKILGGLSAIAVGVVELRNACGTGHGKTARVRGLGPRRAQLAVDAASTYCRTLLATLADPDAPWRRSRTL